MFVNEVVNEVPGVFVLKRLLVDAGLVEELLQIWVDILKVKTMVGVPANVTDVLEICWHANVLLVQPLLASLVQPALVLVLGDGGLQRGASTQTIQGLGGRNTCAVAWLLLLFVCLPLLPPLLSLQ